MRNFFQKIYDFFFKKNKNVEVILNESSQIKNSYISENEKIFNSYAFRSLSDISKDQQIKIENEWKNKNSNQFNDGIETKHKNNFEINNKELIFLQEQTQKQKENKLYNDSNQYQEELTTKKKVFLFNPEEDIKENKKNDEITQKFSSRRKREEFSKKIEESKKIDTKKIDKFYINQNRSNPENKTIKIIRHPKNNQNN